MLPFLTREEWLSAEGENGLMERNNTTVQRQQQRKQSPPLPSSFPTQEIRTGRAHLSAAMLALPQLHPLSHPSSLVWFGRFWSLSRCLLVRCIYPVDRRRCSDLPVCSLIESQRFGRRRGKQSERAHLF